MPQKTESGVGLMQFRSTCRIIRFVELSREDDCFRAAFDAFTETIGTMPGYLLTYAFQSSKISQNVALEITFAAHIAKTNDTSKMFVIYSVIIVNLRKHYSKYFT